MRDFNYSWKAAFCPGRDINFFDSPIRQTIDLEVTGYSHTNALVLAELSRLIYKRDADEIGQKAYAKTRNTFLGLVGLQEVSLFITPKSQGALIVPIDGRPFTILVFRGTYNLTGWLTNICAYPLINWTEGGKVHQGFAKAFNTIWEPISSRLKSMNSPIIITGHSLGGAFALLAATKLKESLHSVYTFGMPPVGDSDFVHSLDKLPYFRIINSSDIIVRSSSFLPYLKHGGELHRLGDMPPSPLSEDGQYDSQDINTVSPISNQTAIRRWYDTPKFISDHAPINYVVKLERFYQEIHR